MTTALLQEPFEAMIIRNERSHLRRLAFIRSVLTANGNRGGRFDGGYQNSLVYVIHPNCHQGDDESERPWQVTTFGRDTEDPSILIPYGHTTHKHLDLAEDHGCYFASAVWEIAWSIAEPPDDWREDFVA